MEFFQILKGALFLQIYITYQLGYLYLIVVLFFTPLLAWHCFGLMPLILQIVDLHSQGALIPADTVRKCTVTAVLFLLACIAAVASLTALIIPVASMTCIALTSLSLNPEVLLRALKETAGKIISGWALEKAAVKTLAVRITIAYVMHILYAAVLRFLVFRALTLGKYSWFWPAICWTLAIIVFFMYLFTLAFVFVAIAISSACTVAITLCRLPVEDQMYAEMYKIAWRQVMHPSKVAANVKIMLFFLFIDRLLGLIYIKAVAASYYDHRVFLAIVLNVIYVLLLAGYFLYLSNVLVLSSMQAASPIIFGSLVSGRLSVSDMLGGAGSTDVRTHDS